MAAIFKSVNHSIVKVLAPDSEVLAEIDMGFHMLLMRRRRDHKPEIQMVCFFEELQVRTIGFVGHLPNLEYSVTNSSARLYHSTLPESVDMS